MNGSSLAGGLPDSPSLGRATSRPMATLHGLSLGLRAKDSRYKHGTPHDRGLRLALLFRNKLLRGPARVKRELYQSLVFVRF